jgi:1-acyl-sn-glycerol-3-phosphate acyltransferase
MFSANASDVLAVCVLALLCLSLASWVVLILRRSPFSPVQSAMYALVYVFVRVLWRARIHGRFPVPPEQGAVVICNHRSSLDPTFIALTVPRVVHWLVAREYCEFLLFRGLLRLCGSIPTNRGGVDTAATKAAIRIVEQGGLVGLFPEGRINTTEQTLLPGRPGAAMIALKARAPVIPCFIRGAPYDGTPLGCLLMPASVHLKIGEPIDLSPYYDRTGDRELLEELTLRFLKAIAELGGDGAFQPQLAGRHSKAPQHS